MSEFAAGRWGPGEETMMNRTRRMLVSVAAMVGLCAAAPAAQSAVSIAPGITFTKDIAPIVFNHCTTCHRPGEVAPFALTNYANVVRHSHEIADLTQARTMPPWKPAEGFGDFIGARRLTDEQINLIQQWVKAGKPEGNPADLPPMPTFKSGWMLGEPDMIVRMPEAFTLQADGPDQYRVFPIPLHLDHDVYVSAVEYRPSNPKIVHHTLFYLDNSGTARQLEAESKQKPGYPRVGSPGFTPSGGLGGWAPGVTPRLLPDGVGRPIRAGADLILHTHFHPSGKIEKEQSVVGLYFTKKLPDKVLVSFPHGTRTINIAPGDNHYVIQSSFTVPSDIELEGIFPHAHLLCKEIKVTAELPDGSTQPLIWIKDWDWNWQDFYHYSHVLQVPRGTKVTQEFVYDNSADNPHNPSNPPQRVRYGEQTKNEMALVFYEILISRQRAEMLQALGRFRRGGLRPQSTESKQASGKDSPAQ
jgi:mono/diheme cytochrome c family protein